MRRQVGVACVVALAGVLTAPVVAEAQEGRLWTLATVEVKTDMILEYEALQREFNAALREAGVTERHAARVVRGGPTSEYHFLSPVEGFADYAEPSLAIQVMGETRFTQWIARVTKCTVRRRIDTLRALPDLSIPLAEGRTPTLAVFRVEPIPSGRREHSRWLAEEWGPAMRAAGMNGVYRFVNALVPRLTYELRSVDDWASLDNVHPVYQNLGEDGWQELFSSLPALPGMPDLKVLQLRPDLSILP